MKKITVALTLILMIALSACADKGAEEALVMSAPLSTICTLSSLPAFTTICPSVRVPEKR